MDAETAAIRIQAYARGWHARRFIIPIAEEELWTNANVIKYLTSRIKELERVCRQQQNTILTQGDKIDILDKIFKARNVKSPIFETYPLPEIGVPEE